MSSFFLGMSVHLFHCALSLKILSSWKLVSCICSYSWISINSVALEVRILNLQPFINSHFHFLIIVEAATCQVYICNHSWRAISFSHFCRISRIPHYFFSVPHKWSAACYPSFKSCLVQQNKMLDYRLPLVPSMSSEGKGGQCILLTILHLHVSIV
jgi:hypothetical protein